MAQPATYGQLDSTARQTAAASGSERLSVGASLLVWLTLSAACWALVFGAVHLLLG